MSGWSEKAIGLCIVSAALVYAVSSCTAEPPVNEAQLQEVDAKADGRIRDLAYQVDRLKRRADDQDAEIQNLKSRLSE